MNFQTLTPSAKTIKMMQTLATGQMVTSREVANIGIISSVDAAHHKSLIDSARLGVQNKNGVVSIHNVPSFGFLNKISPMTAKFAESFKLTSAGCAEAVIKTNMLDGVIIVTDCDITAAGLLLGAAKANCPALILPVGTRTINYDNNGQMNVMHVQGAVTAGKMNKLTGEELIENTLMPSGIFNKFCSVSTFFILMEAAGLAVPNSMNRMGSVQQCEAARLTGEQIVASAADLLSPKKFLTKNALNNITAACLALGGSMASLTAVENLVREFEKVRTLVPELISKTPLYFDEPNQTCTELKKAGGILALLKKLSSVPKLLDETVLTVRGEKLKNALSDITPAELESVKNTSKAVTVHGTACEECGLVHTSSTTPVSMQGKAWVYLSLEDADKAILSGNVPAGSIIVLQNCVDVNVTAVTYAIEGMGKADSIAVITDGICEPTPVLTVTNVTPSSFDNESFANIQNGDIIDIELGRGRLNSNILAKELKNRSKRNSSKKAVIYFGR